MSNRLMKEYEEFEGLRNIALDVNHMVVEEQEDDSALGTPENANTLMLSEVYYQVTFQ